MIVKYSPLDPNIVSVFETHCKEWSPSSFAGKLIGTHKSFYLLIKTNVGFKEINDKYKCLSTRHKFYLRNI